MKTGTDSVAVARSNSKYHAKKVKIDGITFDSMKEARRWYELRLMEKSGAVEDLRRQVKYVLIPSQYEHSDQTGRKKGKLLERECSYIADFVYTQNGKQIVEDTKGFRTAEYKIKRKLMLYVYGIRIYET